MTVNRAMKWSAVGLALAGGVWAFAAWGGDFRATSGGSAESASDPMLPATSSDRIRQTPTHATDTAKATFAGGCFWCMEPPFDELKAVFSTTSGYIGGTVVDPTYKQVSSGTTGHYEAVEIAYDPTAIDYQDLLQVFWINIDPTDDGGQFCDRGPQYRAAIFYHDEEQRRVAEASKRDMEESGLLPGPIVTEIVAAPEFYPAEEYHQDYYRKNPIRYKVYRAGCGRDRRLARVWGGATGG